MTPTFEEYVIAVEKLLKVAQRDTGASVVAAQVLLSVYNGCNWHADLNSLNILDSDNFNAAFTVISGWRTFREYPSSVIDNGREEFLALEEQWQHLHTHNRYENYYKR